MTGPAVALVGAGPGDAGLLTLRAEALLGLAGVVVVDADLEALARLFTRRARVVAVADDLPAVGALQAAMAAGAGPVLRLYRGDPWLHAAYPAERAALEAAGVTVEAVAGIAVEVAVPALAGVPVHVRHLAVACTFGPHQALPAATDPARTLVASGDDAAAMVRAVTTRGDARLPAALVPVADPATAWRGRLEDAAAPVAHLQGPALLVVGAVCAGGPPVRPSPSPGPAVSSSEPHSPGRQGPSPEPKRSATSRLEPARDPAEPSRGATGAAGRGGPDPGPVTGRSGLGPCLPPGGDGAGVSPFEPAPRNRSIGRRRHDPGASRSEALPARRRPDRVEES